MPYADSTDDLGHRARYSDEVKPTGVFEVAGVAASAAAEMTRESCGSAEPVIVVIIRECERECGQ